MRQFLTYGSVNKAILISYYILAMKHIDLDDIKKIIVSPKVKDQDTARLARFPLSR